MENYQNKLIHVYREELPGLFKCIFCSTTKNRDTLSHDDCTTSLKLDEAKKSLSQYIHEDKDFLK